jgi:hypothetical protein
MADVICPQCGRPNPETLDACQFCGAELAPSTGDPWQMRPGQEPIKRNTSEFDKVKLSPADKEPIHPGDAPTKKNTAELEQALPSWLRSLRAKQDGPDSQTPAEPPTGEGLPPAAEPPAAPGAAASSADGMPDWIAGLGAASAPEEEEIPDWLTSLRGKGAAPGGPAAASEPAAASPESDWMSALGGQPQPGAAPQAPTPAPPAPRSQPPAEDGLPDWLEDLQAGGKPPSEPGIAGSKDTGELSAWLSNLPLENATPPAPPPAPVEPAPAAGSDELPDWLNKLKEKAAETPVELPPTPSPDSTPDWLAGITPEAEQAPAAPAAPAEAVPDWLSKLENQAGTGVSTPVPTPFLGETPAAAGQPGDETPDWLSKLQADVSAPADAGSGREEFEVSSEPMPSATPAESLPDWLSNIEEAAQPPAATPALIIGNGDKSPGDTAPAAFSMETPDWLSKLKPEQGAEAAPAAVSGEEGQPSDALQHADLPSWVQAMRPVEDVVADANSAVVDDGQTPEEKGPLAGLRSVLPASPGLGTLRKPPAYSVKLQATDSQQRYAAHLERLISTETETLAVRKSQPLSGRVMRWIIAALLIFVIVVPIATGLQVTPASAVYPPETKAMVGLINDLQPDAPVLVVFDYEPALSGELEAAAAPVIDHLISMGARLTFISTTPTGPALAERFMRGTQSGSNYVSGQQYVNLGYLAGGPAGVLDFANDPPGTASLAYSEDPAVNEKPAWVMPPLANIHALSDFYLIIVLTDSADTARVWIEQAGPVLVGRPMAMVISAQAEPMLLPYYDSGQIKGMVTGLAGGKAYEQVTGRAGLGNSYWNAFSAGLLTAELLIVGGGLWGILGTLQARKKKRGDKA